MEAESRRPKGREGAIPALSAATETLNLAEKISSITPAKAAFGSVNILLATIEDSFVSESDYVELGLSCADVCRVLDRGVKGKKPDELNQSVYDRINQLTSIVADIQRKLVKLGKRNAVPRLFHPKKDKAMIAAWKLDLDKIIQVFNKELTVNTNATISTVRRGVADTRIIVSDSHRNALKRPEDTRGQDQRTHASAPGESPPPLPRSAHGTVPDVHHDTMTRAIVSEVQRNVTNTQNMVSDIHRTVVKGQEGSDGKPPSATASIPGEFPPLPPRTFFGRDELIEKIVDFVDNLIPIAPIGAGGIGKTSIALAVLHHDRIKQRFGHGRRFIRCDQFPSSHTHLLRRISNVIGADVENAEDLIPLRALLSSREMLIVLDNAESILDPQGMGAQEIYAVVEELSRFDNICICVTSRISTTPPDIKHLDVPTLSMGAARDAFYRIYDSDDQSDVTQHNRSLAATIELSLASPMFQQLGPDARALLSVVAFFPQGVDEDNLDWLFPTISNRTDIFDGFCVLSLTHWSNGFITMLAPLRDYLSPKDPRLSTLLCTTKERYFTRMSVHLDPNHPDFIKSRWITSEDVNVEHLLDVFTTIDADSDGVWDACVNFMTLLIWHKKRLIILKPKIERLPDDHRLKPDCLFELSRLFCWVGNQMERTRLLTHTLKLWREREDDYEVARTLRHLCDANRLRGLPKEGIQLGKEAFGIYERLNDTMEQAQCLIKLAWLLHSDKQLDAAEEAASRAINLPEKGDHYLVSRSHRILGIIYRSKGEAEKAIHHSEVVLGIATSFNWHDELFGVHCDLAELFLGEARFDDAHTHIERAKSHTANSAYSLGRAMYLEARVWYKQHRLEEAKAEALRAADVFEKFGAAEDMENCRKLLWTIQSSPAASGYSGSNSRGTKRLRRWSH